VTLPFYASAALLRPGLANYSLEIGAMRQNYGLIDDRYAGLAASGSLRYGVTDWLTLESHAEGTPELGVLGGGAVLKLFSLGVVSAALSGSRAQSAVYTGAGGSSGGQASAGFRRTSRNLSFSVSATYAETGYRDIAAVNGTPVR
jgi:outer membrane usher protein